jgi:MFS transporter, PPP family, 3-phenylpropionic acid transporter
VRHSRPKTIGGRGGALPYWRLSAYYFFYFASLGALVPYWGLYLQSRGFDALAIGQLMAILGGTKIVAPMLWGHLADRTGARMPLVRYGSLAAALAFAGVFSAEGFWGMAAAMTGFSFFWNAVLPQMESVTFNHLGARASRYALVRVWGSVGFILVVVTLGIRLAAVPYSVVPVWLLAIFTASWVATLGVPDSPPVSGQGPAPSLRRLLRRPEVMAFLGACFLMQAGHGIYYVYYSLHLKAAGYSAPAVGALWALGVVAEVLVFLVMHRLLARLGARRVLLWSLGLAVLRWLLIGACVSSLPVLVLAQTLHAATFGIFHASAIHLVHHYFPGRTQGRGQALYNSLSFGAGGAAGSLAGGYLWSGAGPLVTFGAAALSALLGLAAAWRWVDRGRRF